MLRKARLLDVSESEPVLDSVRIPLQELHSRKNELPANSETVLVADVASAAADAVELLRSWGYRAYLTSDFSHGDSGVLRLWNPNPWLADVVASVTPGNALDLGCGTGREAVFLASCGWKVTAVDRLPDALQMGKALERNYLHGSAVKWELADIRSHEVEPVFDLVISCFAWSTSIPERVRSATRPEGRVLIETHSRVHKARFGKPRHAICAPDLCSEFSDWHVQHCSENWRESGRHTVRLLATRP